MVIIEKDGEKKAVTSGAFKALFKNQGWKIVENERDKMNKPAFDVNKAKKVELIEHAEDMGIELDGSETVDVLRDKIKNFDPDDVNNGDDDDDDKEPEFDEMDEEQLKAYALANEYEIEDIDEMDEDELREAVKEAYAEDEDDE